MLLNAWHNRISELPEPLSVPAEPAPLIDDLDVWIYAIDTHLCGLTLPLPDEDGVVSSPLSDPADRVLSDLIVQVPQANATSTLKEHLLELIKDLYR